ncbi:hypothetical protein [Streptomyces sp. NPDC058304]|uniref:hypothetical protein n=1 Tax=Streptomyces sp. NPDC058304 TaxID=3346437 RepID=UPI0036ECD09F
MSGKLANQLREQFDGLGLVAVRPLPDRFDLLVEVFDLQACCGQAGLDDPEVAVGLFRDLRRCDRPR